MCFRTSSKCCGFSSVSIKFRGYIFCTFFDDSPLDLLLIRKFVRRMKGDKRKTGNSQIFKMAANLWPYSTTAKIFWAPLKASLSLKSALGYLITPTQSCSQPVYIRNGCPLFDYGNENPTWLQATWFI